MMMRYLVVVFLLTITFVAGSVAAFTPILILRLLAQWPKFLFSQLPKNKRPNWEMFEIIDLVEQDAEGFRRLYARRLTSIRWFGVNSMIMAILGYVVIMLSMLT